MAAVAAGDYAGPIAAELSSAAVLDVLVERVRSRLAGAGDERVLIGIVGLPGAGKTTLAADLVVRLNSRSGDGGLAAHVPMDGYHLADVELDRLGLRDHKGAPATFDHAGYTALLRRLRRPGPDVVYAPAFDREIEQPIAGAIPVLPGARVIVSEGNYLLLDGPWLGVREVLDEVWFARGDESARAERLLARHIRFGKTEAEARAWMAATDEPNAVLIAATMPAADLVVDL